MQYLPESKHLRFPAHTIPKLQIFTICKSAKEKSERPGPGDDVAVQERG